jgi:hypothetical protein
VAWCLPPAERVLLVSAQHPADFTPVCTTPAVGDAEAVERFPGYRTVKPYLRHTAHPSRA